MGGKIVTEGATVGVLGLTSDDGIGPALGGVIGAHMANEKDIRKLAGFDPSIAVENIWKRLHFPGKPCVTNQGKETTRNAFKVLSL